jgi:predicted nucleic acid-binding protein
VILVDTSVWIDHFRDGRSGLASLLDRGEVLMHPYVVGELACGNLSARGPTLELLEQLRTITVADHTEVMTFIERRRLHGRGIGYIDAHLLASAAIDGARLWTTDRRLRTVAMKLNLDAPHD